MIVSETEIFDKNLATPDNSNKILLMDEMIQHFSPLFNNDVGQKRTELQQNKKDLTQLAEKVKSSLRKVASLKVDIRREKSKEVILDNITYLINHDVLYGENRQRVRSILSSLDQMNDQQIKASTTFIKKQTQKIQKVLT